MGRRIDLIALNALAAAALYLFFTAALESIWAGALCAFCAMLLLRRVLGALTGRLPQRKRLRARARAALDAWAKLPADEALLKARSLLEKAYPRQLEGVRLIGAQRCPPGPAMDVNALLALWRGRLEERLAIVCTSRADAAALSYARTLSRPAVRLIDAPQLISLLEKYPDAQEEAPRARRRLQLSASRERAPRRLLFGALLLGMYLLLGNPLYLAAALATLFLSAMGWKKPPVPRRLFD